MLWPAGPNLYPPVKEPTLTLTQTWIKGPRQELTPSLPTPELIHPDPHFVLQPVMVVPTSAQARQKIPFCG